MTAGRCRGVLIVDDDTDIRETIEEVLADNDFPASGAENGAVALERLRSDVKPPCVILLDMMMPVMDGRTFRLAQRDDPALSNIPVVVLTAHASGERSARELQVDGFLRKPVDLETLLDVIRRYCERDNTSLQPG
ncbi:MAG: response regulator [Deltaproteobacteria bacterium]|nr:MAG: response regulator [Deltaproteobacteria bacterium]TMQ19697.1 MAG: response regulator [Deltaproteobacteria bacterium]